MAAAASYPFDETFHSSTYPFTDNEEELLLGEIQNMAEEAREDPKAFFNFVLKDERSNEPVTVAAHQELIIDFIMAHPKCLVKLPVGHTKSFTSISLATYFLGRDPTMRGAIISATEAQAEKLLGFVRDLIEDSAELHMVFPDLQRSSRRGDAWTNNDLVVQRPSGIRDPSLCARALGSQQLPGSRLNFIIIDDILTMENTATPELRKKTYDFIQSTVKSRLDPKQYGKEPPRLVVLNTPWHPEDAIAALEKNGMPTLTMRIDGEIVITNTDWDHTGLRPAAPGALECRLTAHDPDPRNTVPLWPEVYTTEAIAELRKEYAGQPTIFNQIFMCLARSDEDAMCKEEYIEKCKAIARALGMRSMVPRSTGEFIGVVTGIDLAFADTQSSGDTAYYTAGFRSDGIQVLLDVESGKFGSDELVDKAIEKHDRYGSILVVENNGAQEFVRNAIQKRDRSMTVKAHTTGKEKANATFGVPSLFNDMALGGIALPNDEGVFEKPVQDFVDQCLYYKPGKHTGDILMAAYFVRALARKFGYLTVNRKSGSLAGKGQSFLAR